MEEKEKLYTRLWEEFINKLHLTGNAFDKDLSSFLEGIKYISQIKLDKISHESPNACEERKKIDEKIRVVEEFITKYKEDYYEICQIKGFWRNQGEKTTGRDYYYYIADQKMKASVYYLRYLNFLEHMENKPKEIVEKILGVCRNINDNTKEFSEIKTQLERNSKESEKLLDILEELEDYITHGSIDKEMEQEEYNARESLRKFTAEGILILNTENNLSYLKYMMFNNLMREIQYNGASYRYVWHWRTKTCNLYRSMSGSGREPKEESFDGLPREAFMRGMFQDCMNHMNSPSDSWYSYSEDPYLDIFKYLMIPKEKKEEKKQEILYKALKTGIAVECEWCHNSQTAMFEIVKEAKINRIFWKGADLSFYEFIQEAGIEKGDGIAYAVEIFPQSLAGEKNKQGTVKYMRDRYLPLYLSSWGVRGELSKMKVADDKEVITFGKCYNGEERIQTSLSKEDLIYLLLKIGEKTKGKEIVEKLKERIRIDYKGKKLDDYVIFTLANQKDREKKLLDIDIFFYFKYFTKACRENAPGSLLLYITGRKQRRRYAFLWKNSRETFER